MLGHGSTDKSKQPKRDLFKDAAPSTSFLNQLPPPPHTSSTLVLSLSLSLSRMVFNFTFTFAPQVFGALRLRAGTQSHAQVSAVTEEASVKEESTSISPLSVAYYTDEEEEIFVSTPDALRRLRRRARSAQPLNATMRRKAKKVSASKTKLSPRTRLFTYDNFYDEVLTDADLSSLSGDGGRPRKRARKAASGVPDPDPNFPLNPTNGLYGEQNPFTNVAGFPHWSSSPSLSPCPPQQWLPPAPPLDHGTISYGAYVGGEVRKNKRKRSPGKGSASFYVPTPKSSFPHPGRVSRSTDAAINAPTTLGLEVPSPTPKSSSASSPVLPPSPATTSSPPSTRTNNSDDESAVLQETLQVFAGKKYFIEVASQESGDADWVCFMNTDGSVHTRCRSDSPTCSLLTYLVVNRGLQIEKLNPPDNSFIVENFASRSTPTTSSQSLTATWTAPLVVSDVFYTPPTTTRDSSDVPALVAGSSGGGPWRASLGGLKVETDVYVGQGQSQCNLTTNDEHITAFVSPTPLAKGSTNERTHAYVAQSGASLSITSDGVSEDDTKKDHRQGTSLGNLAPAASLVASSSCTPIPTPTAGVVYSHFFYCDTQLIAVNAWYKRESTFAVARVQLHSSTSGQNTLWLRVLSNDGSQLIDSVATQKHAIIRDDNDGYVMFLVMVLQGSREWQPRFFAIKRGPDAVAMAGYFNAAIPPPKPVGILHASPTAAGDMAVEASPLQISQPSAANQVSVGSEPVIAPMIDAAIAVGSSDADGS
ncbi:hypothetical protein FRB96_003290 [Tulasnella sp. 330]|nr:hypothetical protein FRB96_003290 [Tulasnella sp. 330]